MRQRPLTTEQIPQQLLELLHPKRRDHQSRDLVVRCTLGAERVQYVGEVVGRLLRDTASAALITRVLVHDRRAHQVRPSEYLR